jgi:hypothetical protein
MLATLNEMLVTKYHVLYSDSLQGEATGRQSGSTNTGIIDFSGQPTATLGAKVNSNSNGDWDINPMPKHPGPI